MIPSVSRTQHRPARCARTHEPLNCPLWVATGLLDDHRAPLGADHPLRAAAERALAAQDSWTADEHRLAWSLLLPCWPRKAGQVPTADRLGALAFYLAGCGIPRAEVASILHVDADTPRRRRLLDRGAMRESEVTFAMPVSDDWPDGLPPPSPWRLGRTFPYTGARPLPRVQTVEPVGDDEPTCPRYYVNVADSPPATSAIIAAFKSAHDAGPRTIHAAAFLDEARPSCPIAEALGIDGPGRLGWDWDDDWLYCCPSWRAARDWDHGHSVAGREAA